jgi:hypothetical protein
MNCSLTFMAKKMDMTLRFAPGISESNRITNRQPVSEIAALMPLRAPMVRVPLVKRRLQILVSPVADDQRECPVKIIHCPIFGQSGSGHLA